MTRPRATFPFHGHRTQAQVRMDARRKSTISRDEIIRTMTEQGINRSIIADRVGMTPHAVTRRRNALGLT